MFCFANQCPGPKPISLINHFKGGKNQIIILIILLVGTVIRQGDNMGERVVVTVEIDSPTRDKESEVVKNKDNESMKAKS